MCERMPIPRRPLGRTGLQATIFGLGGEGILRTYGQEKAAVQLIQRALDLGVNYFESARAYAGSELYYGAALGKRRGDIFLTSKTASRSAAGALRDLETTLRNMRTDYLDLWQLHDLREEAEWQQARREGRVRFLGVTGHHDPLLLARAIEGFDFDTVLLPVNAAEAQFRGFMEVTVPAAQAKDMGIIGMKVLCHGVLADRNRGITPSRLIRYALSQPVSLVTVGCDNLKQLEENVAAACAFAPQDDEERAQLLALTSGYAAEAVYYRPL
ncbi:MAG: aldo/keto reductase [Chloroflexota bacterium]